MNIKTVLYGSAVSCADNDIYLNEFVSQILADTVSTMDQEVAAQ